MSSQELVYAADTTVVRQAGAGNNRAVELQIVQAGAETQKPG